MQKSVIALIWDFSFPITDIQLQLLKDACKCVYRDCTPQSDFASLSVIQERIFLLLQGLFAQAIQ